MFNQPLRLFLIVAEAFRVPGDRAFLAVCFNDVSSVGTLSW